MDCTTILNEEISTAAKTRKNSNIFMKNLNSVRRCLRTDKIAYKVLKNFVLFHSCNVF